MNCKNCGAVLTGTEQICPICGANLLGMQQQVPGQVIQQMVQPAPVMPQPVMQQPTPVVPQQPVVQQPMTSPMAPVGVVQQPTSPQVVQGQTPEELSPKKDNKMLLILLIVVAAAAIGVGIFLMLTDKEEPASTPSQSETEYPIPESIKEGYAGYSFTIPNGYTTEITETYGLVVRSNTTIYTIAVDYTNNYEYYKNAFLGAFPAEAANMVKTIGSNEYVAAILTDTEGANGTEYMTTSPDSLGTFVGMVVRSDYTPPTEAEFSILNQMLSTATKENAVTPGSAEDAGTTGIRNYIPLFSKTQFVFS